MSRVFRRTLSLIRHCKDNEIFSLANELSYKLILSIFPFLIFLMTLVAFLEIDGLLLISQLQEILPQQVVIIFTVFIEEVILTKQLDLLSISLALTIYSTSSGFLCVIRCLNRAYEVVETRGFIRLRVLSIVLVLFLTVSIVLTMLLLVFGDKIWLLLLKYNILSTKLSSLYTVLQYIIPTTVITVVLAFIFKLSVNIKLKLKDVLPGAIVTIILWVVVSRIFSIYINNFSKYSVIYGSIGSIFILLIWLNMISVILLIGGSLNAQINLSDLALDNSF